MLNYISNRFGHNQLRNCSFLLCVSGALCVDRTPKKRAREEKGGLPFCLFSTDAVRSRRVLKGEGVGVVYERHASATLGTGYG